MSKKVEELQKDVAGIISSLDALIKLPATFRSAREIEKKIRKLLEDLHKDLGEVKTEPDESVEQDVIKIDALLSELQGKLQSAVTTVGELYEKVRKKNQEQVQS